MLTIHQRVARIGMSARECDLINVLEAMHAAISDPAERAMQYVKTIELTIPDMGQRAEFSRKIARNKFGIQMLDKATSRDERRKLERQFNAWKDVE